LLDDGVIRKDIPVDGYKYKRQVAKDGRVMYKATLNGRYKFWAAPTPEIMAVAV